MPSSLAMAVLITLGAPLVPRDNPPPGDGPQHKRASDYSWKAFCE